VEELRSACLPRRPEDSGTNKGLHGGLCSPWASPERR
jgi:hypothetical protein